MRAAAVRVVRISERRGRGLVAARAVRAGDVVVEDRPIAIGADIAAPRCGTCAGVHDDDDAGRRACESDNAGRRWLAGIDWTSGPLFPAMAGELQIARILGRINRVWDEGLSRLCHATIADDHDGVRDDWRKVVARVTSLMSRGTAEDILPFDTFRRLLGVLHLNCLAVGDADRHVGTVLMGTLSFVNHSCCPNAKVGADFDRRGRLPLLAVDDIAEGDELTIAYVDPTMPVDRRRRHLQWAYGFECDCRLCRQQLSSSKP
ncbi:SET domain-containing protein [Plasmodiophora brassicae]